MIAAPATLPKPLVQDERTLLLRWQRDHDETARESLVRRYLPAARQLARRYARAHESIDDLAQAAMWA